MVNDKKKEKQAISSSLTKEIIQGVFYSSTFTFSIPTQIFNLFFYFEKWYRSSIKWAFRCPIWIKYQTKREWRKLNAKF